MGKTFHVFYLEEARRVSTLHELPHLQSVDKLMTIWTVSMQSARYYAESIERVRA